MKKIYLLLLIAFLWGGCGAKAPQVTHEPDVSAYSSPYHVSATPSPQELPRKRTTSASITVEVEEINASHQQLVTLVKEMDGYIEYDNLSEARGRYYGHIKVPAKQLEATLKKISTLGETTSQSIRQQDVTERLYNQEEELKNLKLFRDKMKALLNRTSSIDEILRIERELNRVQTQIDRIERQLKELHGALDLSSVQVTLKEKTHYGPLGYIGHGLWWAVKKLFVIR